MPNEHYWPDHCMPPDSSLAERRFWYEPVFRGMDEPKLDKAWQALGKGELIRFSMLPTHESAEVFRAYRSGSRKSAILKISEGPAGFFAGKPKPANPVRLDARDWMEIDNWLNNDGLWAPLDQSDRIVFDGDSWIIEHRDEDGLRACACHEPEAEPWTEFRLWFRQFIERIQETR